MANVNIFFEKYKKEIIIVLGLGLISFGLFRILSSKNVQSMAFYHWKSNLDLSQSEESLLLQHKEAPLYLHFMDLVWDEERQFAVPMAQLSIIKPLPKDISIVPVLFIANEVFEKTPSEQLENMATHVIKRLDDRFFENEEDIREIKEIQVDCDWTLSTKEKYFTFLGYIKNAFDTPISATIRLHQVKFFEKTGVPPVDRGILMFYNMGNLNDERTKNSILDIETAKSYMVNFDKYPLSLDVALPIFSWGVVKRNGRVVHLLTGLEAPDLIDSLQYKNNNGNYQVLESSYLKSYYCYEGDEIRLETTSQEQLLTATKLLQQYLKKEKRNICFYHLDAKNLQSFPPEYLEKLVKE
jgi:hypothetical protein